jgi:S1-C subfamily serine protease
MNPTRRTLLAAGLLAGTVVLADAASACPWSRRYYCPPPVYYVPLPPPVVVEPAPAADPTPPARPPEPAPAVDAAAIYKQVVDSVAFIVTPMKGGIAMGSGTLIDAHKRYVLTNAHVVEDADTVFVQFPVYLKDGTRVTEKKKYIDRIPAGQAIKGKVLYRDKTRDLALVQLDSLPPTAKPIPLAKKSVAVGAMVWHLGSPGAVSQLFSITEGQVRAVGTEDFAVPTADGGQRIKVRMVTTTDPSARADSGGPAVNRFGELVGVTESGVAAAQMLNRDIDVLEVWAFLQDKRITLTGDDPAAAPPKPRPPGVPLDPFENQPLRPNPKAGPPDAETAAAALLSRAKLFAEGDDNRPTYIAKLKDVIAKFPDTAAGKEAKKLLDSAMKGARPHAAKPDQPGA